MKLLNKKLFYALLTASLLQITVLLVEYGGAVYPLLTGEEITLKVIPVDPRSLFRGNYAQLRYDINNVKLPPDKFLRTNETVYVRLKQNAAGIYEENGISLTRPDSGKFIKGRYSPGSARFRVRYGIEAFFAPKEEALDLEDRLRDGGVAKIMLASNGRATLKDVVAH